MNTETLCESSELIQTGEKTILKSIVVLISTVGLYLITLSILGISFENANQFFNEVKFNFLPPIILLLFNSYLYRFNMWKKVKLMLLWTTIPVILFLISVRFQRTDPGGLMLFRPYELEIGLLLPILSTVIQIITLLFVVVELINNRKRNDER